MAARTSALTAFLLMTFACCTPPASAIAGEAPVAGSDALRVAKALSSTLAGVVEKVVPAVVGIKRTVNPKPRSGSMGLPRPGYPPDHDEFLRRYYRQAPRRKLEGYGSGVIIDKDGHILTNNHVVRGADKLSVEFNDGTQAEARIVGTDPKTDIAVIKLVNCSKPLHPAVLGDSDKLKAGNIVLAVGSPFRLKHSVTMGIVSAKNRSELGMNMYESYIQTDASINPGNSGGPLVNLDSEVVGINTLINSRSGGSDGIGFAVPVNMIRDVVRQLVQTGHVTRGWLGVGINDVTPEMARVMPGVDGGVAVTETYPSTPAARAGIRAGDVIVLFDKRLPRNSRHLQQLVARIAPGTKVPVEVVRKGERHTLEVVIGRQPDDLVKVTGEGGSTPEAASEYQDERIGVTVRNVDDRLRRLFGLPRKDKGVVVIKVRPGSSADGVGIGPGAMILELDQEQTPDVAAFKRVVKQLKGKKSALVFYRQDRGNRFGVLHFK